MLQKLVRSDYYNEEYPLNEQEYKGKSRSDQNSTSQRWIPTGGSARCSVGSLSIRLEIKPAI